MEEEGRRLEEGWKRGGRWVEERGGEEKDRRGVKRVQKGERLWGDLR